MRLLPMSVFLAASCMGNVARAESHPLGFGNVTCSDFGTLVGEKASNEAILFGWVQGWMAGLNLRELQAKRPVADLLPNDFPIDQQKVFLKNYCVRNRQETLAIAAAALYIDMRTKQGIVSVDHNKKR